MSGGKAPSTAGQKNEDHRRCSRKRPATTDNPDAPKFVESAKDEFEVQEDGFFRCKLCGDLIKSCQNTTNLWNHLKIHNVTSAKKQTTPAPPKKQKSLFDCNFKRSEQVDLDLLYTEAVAKCGCSFNAVARMNRLYELCQQHGLKPLKDNRPIKDRVMKVGERLIEQDKQLIKKIDDGEKFVITLDEWSGNDTRRFMNVTLHLDKIKYLNLGLQRITGSANADNLIKVMDLKLKQLGLKLERDIIGIDTDGCATMLKFGKLLRPYVFHQVIMINLNLVTRFLSNESSLSRRSLINDHTICQIVFGIDFNLNSFPFSIRSACFTPFK